ncbi:hypothetical protein PoB_004282300 [Plakobranchus ocellatus]|uniref:Uncharacterized protein n=1 Tax=Plakobranchus ocellatus TaxID=259542 RepID=A0AAV4BBX8_9GAST|nr:hypothetical protein PoB_004282300 [Plakobranchus ocellatus]
MGYKRDPINCEKLWLDFAVRLLSREAVGKGKGQETVWSQKYKPSWWDDTVNHPWKNPTANPKDAKEVLLEKYEALENHLRSENRFPVELEEESKLWREGKYRELFLLTSLTSLLGKVTNVHLAVEDACSKVDELKATVNQSVLVNIQNCLMASLNKTKQMSLKTTQKGKNADSDTQLKARKRNNDCSYKENIEWPPLKSRKLDCQHATQLTSKSNTSQVSEKSDLQPEDILTFAQRLMAKRKSQSSPQKSKSPKQILPKPFPVVPKCIPPPHTSTYAQHSSLPVCTITLTPEQLRSIWPQSFASETAHQEIPNQSKIHANTDSLIVTPKLSNTQLRDCVYEVEKEPANNFVTLEKTKSNYVTNSLCSNSAAENPSENAHLVEETMSPNPSMIFETEPTLASESEAAIGNSNLCLLPSFDEEFDPSLFDNIEEIEELCDEILSGSKSSDHSDLMHMTSSQNNTCHSVAIADDTIHDDSPGKISARVLSSSPDVGYCSDGSPLPNHQEQEKNEFCTLWPQDGDFLLDKFLFDADDFSSSAQ